MGAGIGNYLLGDPVALVAVLAVLAVFGWAFLSVRRMAKDDSAARRRIADLEIRLNEAESAIASEAHVLVIWRGRDDTPDRIVGSMHGAAQVPETPGALLDFGHWLEREFGLGADRIALRAAQFRPAIQHRHPHIGQ